MVKASQVVTMPAALSDGQHRFGKMWTKLEFLFTQTVSCLLVMKDGGM